MTSPAHLEIERLSHRIGATTILDDVSLSVRQGEILCLLGHSGCGKTTMLRIVGGLERPYAGRLMLGDQEVQGRDTFVPPEARGVGLMFQDYALFPHLSIIDNVAFGLTRRPRQERAGIALAALQRVGLSRYANDYPHMLSGGEQQRVALARALAPEPGLILMDEPFSNLDQRTRESIREETARVLRALGTTAIVVTHDAIEAMSIADRIALMRSGRIVQSGTPEELYQRPNSLFVARYFCDLNEIEGISEGNVVKCALGSFPAPQPMRDGGCIVCIRPQSISLAAPSAGGIAGEIVSRRFLGEFCTVTIGVEGLASPLRARLPASAVQAPGDKVSVLIDPGGILAFARMMDISRGAIWEN